MAWTLPWARKARASPADLHTEDAWSQHVTTLAAHGIPEPGMGSGGPAAPSGHRGGPQALYGVAPSFADLLPWVEYLPDSKSMLLEDGQSVAGFFELAPVGTEGREMAWLWQARDALENALQDSFDELDENPGWCSSTPRTNRPGTTTCAGWRTTCGRAPRAAPSPTSTCASSSASPARHRQARRPVRGHDGDAPAVARPGPARAHGGLPARERGDRIPARPVARAGADDDLRPARRRPRQRGREGPAHGGADIHDWLLRWFNPHPTLLGPRRPTANVLRADRYPEEAETAKSSWPAATSRSACSSASRARTWRTAPGCSTACRTGSS